MEGGVDYSLQCAGSRATARTTLASGTTIEHTWLIQQQGGLYHQARGGRPSQTVPHKVRRERAEARLAGEPLVFF